MKHLPVNCNGNSNSRNCMVLSRRGEFNAGVETFLSRRRYPNYDINNGLLRYRTTTNYTEIVVELVENTNLSIFQIENIMGGSAKF